MRFRLATSVLALGLLWSAPDVRAATPRASVQTLVGAAGQQVQIWRGASARVARTRARQGDLAQRIDGLKRRGDAPRELQRLLAASLAAESALGRAIAAERDARDDVERTVRTGIARIDREIRSLVPALKRGPVADRRAAARRINTLRAARKQLRSARLDLDREVATPRRDWSRYEVRIEPLDGPSELEEKADFVEDTRDKLGKKRLALAALLREAKEERQIARAARDFDTYVRIFDEEARSDRVTRRANGATTLATNDRSSDDSASPTAGFQGGGERTNNAVDPTAPPSNEVVDVPNDGALGGSEGGGKVGAGQNPAGPTVSTPDPTAPPVARDINAELLINLRVSQLAAEDLDLATLLRLVEELEELDRYLEDQAVSIRERARAIADDEAKDLGN